MLFTDLLLVVSTLRTKFPCPNCKKKFADEDIAIVATLEVELLALVHCTKCCNESIVHATLTAPKQRTTRLRTNTEKVPHFTHRSISTDEVLDMHNFLKGFNGDFHSLFSRSL